jgi:hypothetical protein
MSDPSDDPEPAAVDGDGNGTRGTYLVTHADAESAVLEDVETGQVHTLADAGADVDVGDVLTATLVPEPPMEVTWRLAAVHDRRQVAVEVSEESPTRQARDLAAAGDPGDLAREPRAGTGELHVLTVPGGEEAADAAREVADDDATRARAAGMDGIERVEIRYADGVVSVRYLP